MTMMPAPNIKPGLESFGDWFNATFRLWSTNWQVWALQGLILLALSLVPVLLIATISGILVGQRYGLENGFLTAYLGTIYGWYFLLPITLALVGPGMVITALKQLRGQQTSVKDIFSGVGFFWGNFLIIICVLLGLLGCGIGLYVTQAFLFLALPYMVDRKSGAIEAMSFSWAAASSNFWLFVLFVFIIQMLSWVGMSACCIGLVFTIGFYPIAQAVAYESSFGVTAITAGVPPTHIVPPPPYMPRAEDPTYKPEA
ncbi:MAG: hypothetical protein ACYC7E_22795 [Armatimonadota bacterium]